MHRSPKTPPVLSVLTVLALLGACSDPSYPAVDGSGTEAGGTTGTTGTGTAETHGDIWTGTGAATAGGTGADGDSESGEGADTDGTEPADWIVEIDAADGWDDRLQDVAVDAMGTIYAAGYTRDPVADQTQALVVAFNPEGEELWRAVEPAVETDRSANEIALDPVSGTVWVGGNDQPSNIAPQHGPWLAAFDPDDGVMGTVTHFPRVYGGVLSGMVLDPSDGTVVLTGERNGENTNDDVVWLGRYQLPSGFELWSQALGDRFEDDEHGWSVAMGPDGELAVAGTMIPGDTETDFWVGLFDRDGNTLWDFTYDGPVNDFDAAVSVAFAPDGNVVAAGWFRPDDPISSLDLHDDGVVMALDGGSGEALWTATVGELDMDDRLYAVAVANGHLFVGGYLDERVNDQGGKAYLEQLSPSGALVAQLRLSTVEQRANRVDGIAIDGWNGAVAVGAMRAPDDEVLGLRAFVARVGAR